MWRDWRCDDSRARSCELSGNEGNTLQVLVALIRRKAKLRRKLRTDGVAEQERYAATAVLVEDGLEGAGDGVLAGVV